MYPIIKNCVAFRTSLMYLNGKKVVTLPGAPTSKGEKKGKQFTLREYRRELQKPYSQIAFYRCIVPEFKETIDDNWETASSVEFKNPTKSISSILDTLDGSFNDFSLNYLNLTNSNNQEFTLNNETPIFKSCTAVITKKIELK